MGDWKYIQDNLKETINMIFNDYNINDLSFYEKRNIIFEYLVNDLKYDYDLLEQIMDFKINKTKVTRNPIKELYSVMNNKIGICNAISQYYKLLLEIVGIKAYCVICDDGTEVKHQLNLVYDEASDLYSFDDVTSVIVGRGTTTDFFDYDLVFANSINQGNRDLMNNQKFFIVPEEHINYLVNREISLTENLDKLPDNIMSVKNKSKTK